jgi:proline racemase
VPDLPYPIEGATVADRRQYAITDPAVDGARQLLCFEPRGHADMYGGFITPPDDEGAMFGVLFWHKDGFSTACGHGTIALGVWAVESGLVAADPDGATDVKIDVPSGRVTARVHCQGGQIEAVDFVNVGGYLIAAQVPVETSRGPVVVDLSFGGAVYAQLDAASVGLTVEPADAAAIVAIGREIKWALDGSPYAQHPSDPRLSGVYGTIVYEDLGPDGVPPGSRHQRNATVFADGELDRSPCGSGTSARLVTLTATGRLTGEGAVLIHDSIVGSRFVGRVVDHTSVDGRPAMITAVSGMAYRTGAAAFSVDPRDPLVPGFVLR